MAREPWSGFLTELEGTVTAPDIESAGSAYRLHEWNLEPKPVGHPPVEAVVAEDSRLNVSFLVLLVSDGHAATEAAGERSGIRHITGPAPVATLGQDHAALARGHIRAPADGHQKGDAWTRGAHRDARSFRLLRDAS